MIWLASHPDQERGWSRHARGLVRALNRFERTELLALHGCPRPPLGAPWRGGRRDRDSVGIMLGAIERTAELRTRWRVAAAVTATSRLPRALVRHLGAADMVWVPTHWGRELLVTNGVPAERIRIVPAGVDPAAFVPAPEGARDGDPVFRFVCVGRWEERTGTAALVQAFAAEFDPGEPVELVMHCGTTWARAVNVQTEIARAVATSGRALARVVASPPVERAEYVALLQRADAFVLPTRGEGWGLPILEAMACGLPCIVTGHGGLREYANPSNAYLVDVLAMDRVYDPEFYQPGWDWGTWARPDPAHLRRLMRHVVEHRAEARERGRRARRDAQTWSWDLAARQAVWHLAELRRTGGETAVAATAVKATAAAAAATRVHVTRDAAGAAGLKYVSVLEDTGYGVAARAYLRGLVRAGVPVTWQPMVNGPHGYRAFEGRTSGDPMLDGVLHRDVPYDTVLVHCIPEYYPLWAGLEPGKRLVGYTTWETNTLPAHWPALLERMALLLVPSRWNAEVFRAAGVRVPIEVVPHVLEAPPAAPAADAMPLPGVRPDDVVFYGIGPWTHRKAPWLALEAYWRAFGRGDPVCLVLKVDGPDWTAYTPGPLWQSVGHRWHTARRACRRLARARGSGARVRLIAGDVPDAAIHALHARGDCYLSLCRAEGWGLGAFDAAGRGKPVVITGFGGQLDYLPAECAYLVAHELEEVARAGVRQRHVAGTWAKPDVAHAAALLRQVFDDRAGARARGEALGRHVREHFAEGAVVGRMLAALRRAGWDARDAAC